MSEPQPRGEAELAELISSIEEPAPAELHRRVQAMIDVAGAGRGQPAGNPGRVRLGLGIAVLAAGVLGLLLVLAGTGSTRFEVNQAAALALAAPTGAAPQESAGSPGTLRDAVDGIAFPYWAGRFHWRASGSRLDTVGGRRVATVFYTGPAGRRVGYAIASGPAPALASGTLRRRHGTVFHLTRLDGAPVLSWLRAGHLCVVTGRGVSASTLLALAGWREPSARS